MALSINLTGGVFVNQSAAFSDYHGTGANPAANAALTDAAFVADRSASSSIGRTSEPWATKTSCSPSPAASRASR